MSNQNQSIKPKKSGKSGKSGKSTKSDSKSKSYIELPCKFRGKYDLDKKNSNKEINLENAINLFEVIYKKNEMLFKDTTIKMHTEKKIFFYGKKGSSKRTHHYPYTQVNKFFVLHRDPTMIIMGVNHKVHKFFLVFQFNNVDDLKTFCDEIEGVKKVQNDTNEEIQPHGDSNDVPVDVPEIQIENTDNIDGQDLYEDPRDFEKISIHSAMLNNNEMTAVDFDESFYEPDFNFQNLNEPDAVSASSSRPSSRSSNSSDTDNRVHCDDLSQSKLKDLRIKSGNEIYSNVKICEDITCINYSRNNMLRETDKTGSIYMYCAQFKNTDWSKKINDDLFSLSSTNENRVIKKGNDFHHFEPKLITANESNNFDRKLISNNESNNFNHFEPKLISNNDSNNFNHFEPKLISNNESNNFNHFEPKLILNNDSNNFDHFEPKMLNNDYESFNHYEPKLNQNEDLPTFENFEPKFIAT